MDETFKWPKKRPPSGSVEEITFLTNLAAQMKCGKCDTIGMIANFYDKRGRECMDIACPSCGDKSSFIGR